MDIGMARKIALAIKKEVQGNVFSSDSGDEVYVGADGEATYRLDNLAEKAAIKALEGEPVAVLSEEAGLVYLDKKPEYLCVLDPLDGSTNAVSGIPFYCASIALAPWSNKARVGDVKSGVIVNLVTGDVFEAEKAMGARLNGRRLKASKKTSLEDVTASLYLKSGYDVISAFSKVRAMGAVALELAHVAAGGIDGLIDNRNHLKVTDIAAGKLLVEEASGRVTDVWGNDLNQSITKLERASILAAGNPRLHALMLREVSG